MQHYFNCYRLLCIRVGFLKRDNIDEEKYKKLWDEGMGHHQIMRQLNEAKEQS